MMRHFLLMMMCAVLIISANTPVYAAQEQPMMTLDLALTLCLKKDVELSVLQNQWYVKGSEMKALKLASPKWVGDVLVVSLPTKEDMAIRQRAAAIQAEQTNLERQYKSKSTKLLNDTRQQFFELLITEATAAYNYERIQNLQSAYAVLYPDYLKGKVKLDALDQNKTLLKEAQQAFDTASGAAVSLRNALFLQTGSPSVFTSRLEVPSDPFVYTLDERLLAVLQQQAILQSVSVQESKNAALVAEKELNTLIKLYEIVYPQSVQSLKSTLALPARPYEAVFNAYLEMTNTSGAGLLVKTELPKVYPVVQGFNVYQLPVDWLSPLPNALTYWQQPPSPINSALVALDLKQHELSMVQDSLNKEVQSAFSNLQLTVLKQTELESGLKVSEAMLEKLKKANLIGVSRYEDVLSMEDLVKRTRLEVLKNRLTLYTQLSQLEYLSGGALGSLLPDKTIGDAKRLQAVFGNKAQTPTAYGSAFWTIENNSAQTQFEFALTLPEIAKVTHFQLFDENGKELSKPQPLQSTLVHDVFAYKENAYLTLVLFEKNKVKYTFKIPKDAIAGKLKL